MGKWIGRRGTCFYFLIVAVVVVTVVVVVGFGLNQLTKTNSDNLL